MAAPVYSTDLITLATADEVSGWVSLTGTDGNGKAYNAQSAPAYQNNDYASIQGSFSVTQDCTVNNSVGSLAYPAGGITVPTDGAVFVWHNFSTAFCMGTYAQGGQRVVIGSGLNDFKVWNVSGNDVENTYYGGFLNHVANPTVSTDTTAGTPTSIINYIGSAVYVVKGMAIGRPHQCDAIRYGRGASIFEFGDGTLGYANIEDFATKNDLQANRWGLVQKLYGGYLFKGKMQLGSATNVVNFTDADRIVFIQWTPKVTQGFNCIEVQNAASVISMTRIQFVTLSPATTASRGNWINTANAVLALSACTFSDLYTFTFGSNTTVSGTTFNRCNRIIQASSTITGCTFNKSDSSSTVLSNNLSTITLNTFVSSGSNHAIEATTPGDFNWNNTATGYASVNGSTGNEIFYNNSGGLINLTRQAGTTVTVRNGAGATTVLREANPAPITLNSAAKFGLLCLGAITGSGSSQANIGSVSGGVAPTVTSNGTVYPTGDAAVMAAAADFDAAYAEALNRQYTTLLSAAAYDIGGLTLTRGIYKVGAACTLTSPVTFDGAGDSTSIFIMQVGAAFGATAATGNVKLINGALAKNVFWQIVGAASLGANTAFVGTMLCASTVTFGASTTFLGRILNCKTGSTITLAATVGTDPDPGVTLTMKANVSLVGAEIRVYDFTAGSHNYGAELTGVESCTTATYDYVGGAGSQGKVVWIQIMQSGYVEFGQQITMPQSSGNFLPILTADTNG